MILLATAAQATTMDVSSAAAAESSRLAASSIPQHPHQQRQPHNNHRSITLRSTSSRSMSWIRSLLLLTTLLLVPLASPFASGSRTTPSTNLHSTSTTSSAASALHPRRRIQEKQQQQQQLQQHASTPLLASSTSATTTSATSPTRLQRFLGRFQSGKNDQHQQLQQPSLVSRLLFRYATPLLHQASARPLDAFDALEMPQHLQMNGAVDSLASIYNALQKKHQLQLEQAKAAAASMSSSNNKNYLLLSWQVWLLTKALFLHQRQLLLTTGLLRLVNTAIQAFPALLVARLLRLIEQQQGIGGIVGGASSSSTSAAPALWTAVTLLIVLTTKLLIENQYFHHIIQYSTKVRGSVQGLLFDKTLRLPSGGSGVVPPPIPITNKPNKFKRRLEQFFSSKDNTQSTDADDDTDNNMRGDAAATATSMGAGGIINLMQSDASILESVALQIHTTWDGCLQMLLYSFLLYRFMGPSVLWGIGILFASIPLGMIPLRILNRLARVENQAKDARNKRTAEALAHMKLLKLFGWQDEFANDIQQYRHDELRTHAQRGMVRALYNAMTNAVPAIVLVVTLTAHAKSGKPLLASTIFTAISLFNQLRFPLWLYPQLIDSLANGQNAMRRIANFLSAEENVPYVLHVPAGSISCSNIGGIGGGSVEMQNGNFLWPVNNNNNNNNAATSTKTSSTELTRSTSTNSTESSSSSSSSPSAVNTSYVAAASTTMPPALSPPLELLSSSSSLSPGSSTTLLPALSNVNFKVQAGEVVAVVGTVASGKSALIKGLLGELTPAPRTSVPQQQQQQQQQHAASASSNNNNNNDHFNGLVVERPLVIAEGNVAYCSQEAWLPKGTIRDAIVFGREFDKDRYRAAIYDAGLDKDIEGYDDDENNNDSNNNRLVVGVNYGGSNGADSKQQRGGLLRHDTDVGEGGSALSGGQRARIALARALYTGEDAKVFLLDDCLAALDASVGSTVFERLVRRLRLQNAAVLMVTNDPSIPRRCDRVILMGKVPSSTTCSTIIDSGTYDELLERGHDLRSYSSLQSQNVKKLGQDSNGTDLDDGFLVVQDRRNGTDTALHHSPSFPPSHNEIQHHHDVGDEQCILVNNSPQRIRIVKQQSEAQGPADCTMHADPECHGLMECCPDALAGQVGVAIDRARVDDSDVYIVKGPEIVTVYNFTSDTGGDSLLSHSTTDKRRAEEPASGKIQTKAAAVSSADDAMSVGAVPISAYLSYFKSVRNPLLVVAMVASFLTVNAAQFFQQYTVASWTSQMGGAAAVNAAAMSATYLGRLVNAAIVVSVFLWIRSFLTMKVGVRASEFLHSRMLSSVFAAPMTFFDATPSGQLLSRFGKEMETVDKGVPDSIMSVLFCVLAMSSSIAALTGVITPAMLVPLAVVGILYAKTMSIYRRAGRDMKRAETKTRSPIYTHYGEALRGVETIRSIPGSQRFWSNEFRSLSDFNLRSYFTVKVFDRWLTTRLENLGNAVVFATAVTSVLLTRAGRLGTGAAGWGLTQSLAVTGLLTWAVRCFTDLETNMLSVVRVKELTELESQEAVLVATNTMEESTETDISQQGTREASSLALRNSSALVESGWPWKGNVRFNNVSMRYNPAAPLVLQNVDLNVPAGTSIGLVGRTGSGKSSLLLTLFRLVEIEAGGSIEIDGVDIRSVDLQSLRQSLAIIPQDPILFQGTIAFNLDATGKASPEEMWAALRAASPSLALQFENANGLDTKVSEGGKDLSLGQRQLICLARALVRKSKILVLDEATSSVDSKTDQQVQETIRREFVDKGVTVITVAHRLDSVLDYDKIAVMGDGGVLEYGAPNELLRLQNGELRRLVDADSMNKRKGAQRQPDPVRTSGS